MIRYYPKEGYEKKKAKRYGAERWMLNKLKLNPSYLAWGVYEDYMIEEDSGWSSRIILDSWDEHWETDKLNELVNFYYAVDREVVFL